MHGVDHHPAENLTRHCVHAPQLPRALLNAAWEGDVESSTRLLQQGAPVEARNEDGATALILAGNNGHKVAEALLQAKAEANAKDRDRKSALDLATANGHTAVIELLSNSTQSVKFYLYSVSIRTQNLFSKPNQKRLLKFRGVGSLSGAMKLDADRPSKDAGRSKFYTIAIGF
eukprot:g53416.t1